MSLNLNLQELIYHPKVNALDVQAALERRFPIVRSEWRNEGFFAYQIRCTDESGRTRLVVRFGYSVARDRWIFEVLPGERKQ